jgi:glycosyltransferase involved in cell wall biosynthesis
MQPEVVHSYAFYTNFAAWWATLGLKTVVIGSVRSDFYWAKRNTGLVLGRLSARWPRSQIFNSVTAAKTARCSSGLFVAKRLFVVRNGLDLRRFRDVPTSNTGRACIIGVGSLFAVKRWERLLAASAALKQQGLDFLTRLVGDGPLRKALMQRALELGIAERVEFIAHSDDIPGLLAEATLLVHTSDNEGCPNVVMEAMACGRAVVATDAGDVPLLVDDGKTGFIVRRGDDATLVTRMETLITDRNLCRRMGEAGRAKAEREFGLGRLVAETLAAYRAIGWKDT